MPRFAYTPADGGGEHRWLVRQADTDAALGMVLRRPGEATWPAVLPEATALMSGFEARRAAALWLWERHVDMPGQNVLASSRMARHSSPTPEPLVRTLARRAGLPLTMAAHVVERDPRTVRRWASPAWVGRPLPHDVVDQLRELAEENEAALAAERAGQPGRRPLRDRRLGEIVTRAQLLADSPRNTGPQRMQRAAERALALAASAPQRSR